VQKARIGHQRDLERDRLCGQGVRQGIVTYSSGVLHGPKNGPEHFRND